MKDFINERWRAILACNGLLDFDALWNLDAPWFEEPNHRRGGWSGVSRYELSLPEGGRAVIFLKRQENHGTPSLRHPVRGIPTFYREFKRIMSYRDKGVLALEPVYFAVRQVGKDQRAILATEELTGFISLEEQVQLWVKSGGAPIRLRRPVLSAVAHLLRSMHSHGIRHGCFYTKHVFVRLNAEGAVDVRVIDLEKSHVMPLASLCALRDLSALSRFSSFWSRADKMHFLKEYLAIPRMTFYAKWLWRAVAARLVKRHRS